jgi:hypothetical protein
MDFVLEIFLSFHYSIIPVFQYSNFQLFILFLKPLKDIGILFKKILKL